jgi:hypothetical protein
LLAVRDPKNAVIGEPVEESSSLPSVDAAALSVDWGHSLFTWFGKVSQPRTPNPIKTIDNDRTSRDNETLLYRLTAKYYTISTASPYHLGTVPYRFRNVQVGLFKIDTFSLVEISNPNRPVLL